MSNDDTLKTFTLPPGYTVKTSGWHQCSEDGLLRICVVGVDSIQWKGSQANICLVNVTTSLNNDLTEREQVDPHHKLRETGQEYCVSGDDVIAKAGIQVQVNGQEIPQVKDIFINLGNQLKESGGQIVALADKGVTNPARRLVLLANISTGYDKKAELTERVASESDTYSDKIMKFFTEPKHPMLDVLDQTDTTGTRRTLPIYVIFFFFALCNRGYTTIRINQLLPGISIKMINASVNSAVNWLCNNSLAISRRNAAGNHTLELHPLCARHIIGYDAGHGWSDPNFFGETPSFCHFQKVLLDHVSGADVTGAATPNHRCRNSSGNSERKQTHQRYQSNCLLKKRRSSDVNDDDDDDEE